MRRLLLCVSMLTALLVAGCGGGGPGAPVDPRNGVYFIAATDGGNFRLLLDLNGRRYTMLDARPERSGRLITTPDGSFALLDDGAAIAGTQAIRFADNNVLIGNYNFGTGVIGFIATRGPSQTDIGALNGDFNIFGVDTPVGLTLPRISVVTTANFSNGILSVCNSPQVASALNCPFGAQGAYRIDNSGFQLDRRLFATPLTVGLSPFIFRAVPLNGDIILVWLATDASGTQQFRIGFRNSPGLVGGGFFGASSAGDLLSISITGAFYSANGSTAAGLPFSIAGALTTISPLAPSGLATTTTALGPLFIMTGPNIGAAIGAPNSAPAGFIQLFIR